MAGDSDISQQRICDNGEILQNLNSSPGGLRFRGWNYLQLNLTLVKKTDESQYTNGSR